MPHSDRTPDAEIAAQPPLAQRTADQTQLDSTPEFTADDLTASGNKAQVVLTGQANPLRMTRANQRMLTK